MDSYDTISLIKHFEDPFNIPAVTPSSSADQIQALKTKMFSVTYLGVLVG